MKKQKRTVRFIQNQPPFYTLVDEMMASPTVPLPHAGTANRVNTAHLCLEAIRNGEGRRDEWEVLATICNMFEVMLTEGFVKDPNGLLPECIGILLRAVREFPKTGGLIPFQPGEYEHLNWMIVDWEECLMQAPARVIIRSFRLTDKGQREQAAKSGGHASFFLAKML